MRPQDLLLFLGLMSILVLLPTLFLRFKLRTLRHTERMAALEKGVPLPVEPVESGPWTPRIYLLRGLIWLFSGIAIVVFLAGLATTSIESDTLESRMWRAEQLRSSGMPEEQWKRIINEPQQRQHMPI